MRACVCVCVCVCVRVCSDKIYEQSGITSKVPFSAARLGVRTFCVDTFGYKILNEWAQSLPPSGIWSIRVKYICHFMRIRCTFVINQEFTRTKK